MAFYTDVVVARPARTRMHDIRGNRYIYYVASSEKIEGLKYPRQKRIAIGKPAEGEGNGMHPNDNYFKLFPDERRKLKTPNENRFSDTLKIGAAKALQAMARDAGLSESLRARFGEGCSNFILDCASCTLINESMSEQCFRTYMRDHAVLSEGGADDADASEYFRAAADIAKIHEFFGDWMRECGRKGGGICIFYCSADIDASAGAGAEGFGNAEGGRAKPVANLACVFDRDSGIPLFYDLRAADARDADECARMLDKARAYGLNDAIFVLDRGRYGKESLERICQISDGYVAMAGTSVKSVERAIDAARDGIESLDAFMEEDNIFRMKTEGGLPPDEKAWLCVYSNPADTEFKVNFYRALAEDRKYLAKKTGCALSECEIRKYGAYFDLKTDKAGRLISFESNGAAQREALKNAGFFAIASNLNKSPKEICAIYKMRNSIEKAFRCKACADFGDFGAHDAYASRAKTFICFVASILKAHMLKRLEGLNRENKKYRSVPACVAELEKIEASRFLDGRHAVLYSLTEPQKDILNALNVPLECMDDIGLYE